LVKYLKGESMTLSRKIILSFIALITIIMAICLVNIFLKTNDMIINEIKEKAIIMAKAFESQLYSGYGRENSSGKNEIFQQSLKTIKSALPEIIEINLYKINSGIVVASSENDMIGKDVDPEDIAAAKNDSTVILFANEDGKRIIDITAPLHYENEIDYVIGIKIDTISDQKIIAGLLAQTLIIGSN
jgi:hypothetical protein